MKRNFCPSLHIPFKYGIDAVIQSFIQQTYWVPTVDQDIGVVDTVTTCAVSAVTEDAYRGQAGTINQPSRAGRDRGTLATMLHLKRAASPRLWSVVATWECWPTVASNSNILKEARNSAFKWNLLIFKCGPLI